MLCYDGKTFVSLYTSRAREVQSTVRVLESRYIHDSRHIADMEEVLWLTVQQQQHRVRGSHKTSLRHRTYGSRLVRWVHKCSAMPRNSEPRCKSGLRRSAPMSATGHTM